MKSPCGEKCFQSNQYVVQMLMILHLVDELISMWSLNWHIFMELITWGEWVRRASPAQTDATLALLTSALLFTRLTAAALSEVNSSPPHTTERRCFTAWAEPWSAAHESEWTLYVTLTCVITWKAYRFILLHMYILFLCFFSFRKENQAGCCQSRWACV